LDRVLNINTTNRDKKAKIKKYTTHLFKEIR